MVAKIVKGTTDLYFLANDQHSDAVEQLEEALGALQCLEFFNDPNIDLTGFDGPTHIRRMALACASIARQVHAVQAILIEAKSFEQEARHG